MMLQQLEDGGAQAGDFLEPPGEPALVASDSLSWSVFANPITLMIGGIAAVILELAEPKIRSGVWDHTNFRTDPLKRMRRTGAAAMITVYAASSRASRMIEGVRRMHDKIHGVTPDGIPYRANEPELLGWVHSTAAFGFLEAYHRYVRPLSIAQRDIYFAEGAPIARLYGAHDPPSCERDWNELVTSMTPRLEPSGILLEFLAIMKNLPLLPATFRPLNRVVLQAAIDLLPEAVGDRLQLPKANVVPGTKGLLRFAALQAEHLHLATSPISLARVRLGAANRA
jgi:uncharacterized protein (DUF2236 family)